MPSSSSSEQKQQMDINNIYLKATPYDTQRDERVGKKSIKHICCPSPNSFDGWLLDRSWAQGGGAKNFCFEELWSILNLCIGKVMPRGGRCSNIGRELDMIVGKGSKPIGSPLVGIDGWGGTL